MRKSVLAIVGAFAFIVGPAAFAQQFSPTASHNIDVKIPEVAFLRITTPGTSLTFAPGAQQLAKGFANGTPYTMSGTSGQDVLQALVNKGSWTLGVSVDTSGSPTTWATSSASGLALSQITVTPGTRGTGVPALVSSFNLGSVAQAGASLTPSGASAPSYTGMALDSGAGGGKTLGWQNVGIDAGSYTLSLTGNESPGEYSVVVTYVLSTP